MVRTALLIALLIVSCNVLSDSLALPQKVPITSKYLNEERTLQVLLPPGYEQDSMKRYPVVYQLQSSDTYLAAASAIRNLSSSGQMPDVILVGIEHQDKFAELSVDAQRSTEFYQHLLNEVKPFIEKNYRTENFSILSGWSVGGGFVIHSMLNSAPFNGFFAFSPMLSFELDIAVYRGRLQQLANQKTFMVMSLGNEQGDFLQHFEKLSHNAEQYGPHLKVKVHADFDHKGNAWVSQFFGFKALFDNWTPSASLTNGGLQALQSHYNSLSKTYGFAVAIPKEVLVFSAYSTLSQGEIEKGEGLVRFALQHHPITVAEFASMSDFFKAQKQLQSHEILTAILQE